MNNTITYLNTDLVLTSDRDLKKLAKGLEAGGLYSMNPIVENNGSWHASFETNHEHPEPALAIAVMLSAIQALPPELRRIWDGCSQREFNIGYDSGEKPWAFNQGLSNEI